MEFDITDIRQQTKKLYPGINFDINANFFYDESENIRKLRFKNGKLNILDPKCFVLGGIWAKSITNKATVQNLFEQLGKQFNQPEIKFKDIAHGSLTDILRSKKLGIFFKWILKSKSRVHFSVVDPLYYSFVDIIDSILPETFPKLLSSASILKTDLSNSLSSKIITHPDAFIAFNYPNVTKDKKNEFLDFCIAAVERNRNCFNSTMLKAVIQEGKNLDDLLFLDGYDNNTLLNSFSEFYRNRTIILSKSHHVFDIENQIQTEFKDLQLLEDGTLVNNYSFQNSSGSVYIQLSDIFIGFTAKLINAIAASVVSGCDDFFNDFCNDFDTEQVDNLQSYFEIINQSNKHFGGSFHWVCPLNIHKAFWDLTSTPNLSAR